MDELRWREPLSVVGSSVSVAPLWSAAEPPAARVVLTLPEQVCTNKGGPGRVEMASRTRVPRVAAPMPKIQCIQDSFVCPSIPGSITRS